MKTKKIRKRLSLKKVSIAHLDKYKIDDGKGGLPLKGGILDDAPSKPCKTQCEPACCLIFCFVCLTD